MGIWIILTIYFVNYKTNMRILYISGDLRIQSESGTVPDISEVIPWPRKIGVKTREKRKKKRFVVSHAAIPGSRV